MLRLRNTPTGVGKTAGLQLAFHPFEKHPHGRGEDAGELRDNSDLLETPPRAWGRRGLNGCGLGWRRNTPTGVGKTSQPLGRASARRKHPHGRGEDSWVSFRGIP